MNITIVRENQFSNRLRKIAIYINGEKKATIKNNETIEIETNEHEIELVAKIDWCKTKPIKVNAAEDNFPVFELGSNLTGFDKLKNLYYVFFKTSEYLYLKKKK